MDPYRVLNKKKKLPFNFKMWFKSKIDTGIDCVLPFAGLIFIACIVGFSCYGIKKENQKNREQDALEIKFFEAKCFPNLFLEEECIRQDILKLTCVSKDGKQNEIYVDLKEMIK